MRSLSCKQGWSVLGVVLRGFKGFVTVCIQKRERKKKVQIQREKKKETEKNKTSEVDTELLMAGP